MRIPCPFCGEREASEFSYLGDATLANRPAPDASEAFADYVYLRDNPRGPIDEFAHHSGGCRAWLVVSRDTKTHEVFGAVIARNFKHGSKP